MAYERTMAETIDWARTLLALGQSTVDDSTVDGTLDVVLKHVSDHARARKHLWLKR